MENINKVKIGISHGDFNGVGYEIIIKTFVDQRMMEMCTPIVYGSSKIASYHRKAININDFSFNLIKKADLANTKRPNIINIYNQEAKIELGKCTELAGELSFLALEAVTEDLKNGKIDVLVTAPINKKNIQSKEFNFPGHTEYLARKFDSNEYLMLMVSDTVRIGVITGHVPVKEVSSHLSVDLILKKMRIMNQSLIKDFGIRRPKIAVLGLNPHAGDDGVIGKEENEIINTAIKRAFNENILAFGPFPADGFFGSSRFTEFDGILAMYHDQGMIPFKIISFDKGVNFTAGLPFIRTSPAHGTAYDIAGKNIASPVSFREAVYLACDIYKNRSQHKEISNNPLKTAVFKENSDDNGIKEIGDEQK